MEKPLVVANPSEPETMLRAPNGFDEIIAAFGDIREYVGADGLLGARWQADFLTSVSLPFPMRLAWDPARTITQITCHRRLTRIYSSVFLGIQEQRLQAKVTSFGGCFAFRQQRTGSKLSAHSWGIAIDLNSESNAQSSAGDMDVGIIEIFLASGFKWGGDWHGRARDPMHFQFCTGY